MLPSLTLAKTVTVLLFNPDLPLLLNTTLIAPFSPGAMGVLGKLGTVQPQVTSQRSINNGFFPVFVK